MSRLQRLTEFLEVEDQQLGLDQTLLRLGGQVQTGRRNEAGVILTQALPAEDENC